jgi:glycosyltransferase involved in cell wall biosynthesis
MPDITVVIPTYNRKKYLQQAIGSCFNGNEGAYVEVLVVDDGSTDGTRSYLDDLDDDRVRPVFQKHQGGQVARNRGLAEARAEYVKFLDDDDWLKEGALQAEHSALQNARADISYGAYDFVEGDGAVLKRENASPVEDPVAALFTSELLTHPLRFTYRRAFLDDVEWDPTLPCRQDVDFALKAATKDPQFVRVTTTVGCFRQHEGDRVSSTMDQRDGVNPPRIHASILLDTIEKMERDNTLNKNRKEAAARGLWVWAHLLSMQDWAFFEELYGKIQELHPSFTPNRRLSALSVLDEWVGAKRVEYVVSPIRKISRILS